LIGWRVELLPACSVALAGGEVTAWIIPKHSHGHLSEGASEAILLAFLVPRAVSLSRCRHQGLRKRPIVAPETTV
jgi:glutamate/tyrosine decarboxylase-like PLP-dependent enzyme